MPPEVREPLGPPHLPPGTTILWVLFLVALQYPRGQQTPAPELLKVPGVQDRQALIELLPVDGLKVPSGQDKHALIDVLPVDGLKVPAGQEMQFLVAKFQPGR